MTTHNHQLMSKPGLASSRAGRLATVHQRRRAYARKTLGSFSIAWRAGDADGEELTS